MDSGKTIVSEGLELSDVEEDVLDSETGTLPHVFLDITFTDESTVSVPCVLSSIDSRSVSLFDFPIKKALVLMSSIQDAKLKNIVLRADDLTFEFAVTSDVYISTMGSSCSLSLSRPGDE